MINGEHDEIDFDFVVGGEICWKLFFLVDCIYHSHMILVIQVRSPHTNCV
jgi:hypothetical protein